MGFFDRFSSKKPEPVRASTDPTAAVPASSAAPAAPGAALTVRARLNVAREKLEAKDLPAAMSLYEGVLAEAGDRADVLVAISGDLGSHGFVAEIIELIAPRYDADRHGPATGLNLLQAYLAVRNADAAQHVLDILFALKRPDIEERLHGFSNAIADLMTHEVTQDPGPVDPSALKVGLVTLSKPIWFYGLEPLAARLLPPKEGRMRRIAFAQLSLPGRVGRRGPDTLPDSHEELERLARSIPLWMAETFYFSALYSPVAAIGQVKPPNEAARLMTFSAEWNTENLRQLVDTTEGGLDYVFTGTLRMQASDYELSLRVWDVKSFRQRRSFDVRWTPGTAEAALAQVHGQIRGYMEWSPASAALAYAVPVRPRAWLDVLHASLGTFLMGKDVIGRSPELVSEHDWTTTTQNAPTGETASLACLTLRARAHQLGFEVPEAGPLARSPLVNEAQAVLS